MIKYIFFSALFLLTACLILSTQADDTTHIGKKGFELRLSCHLYGTEVVLTPCVPIERSVSVQTPTGTKVYDGLEVFQNNGRIYVPKEFKFALINPDNSAVILKLSVYDVNTGKLVYEDEAGSYGVVKATTNMILSAQYMQ